MTKHLTTCPTGWDPPARCTCEEGGGYPGPLTGQPVPTRMSDSKKTLSDVRAELERLAKENPEAFARATREAGRESEMMLSAYVKAIFSNRAGFGDSVPPMPPTDIQLLASIVLCPHGVARFAPCADCLSASKPLATPDERGLFLSVAEHTLTLCRWLRTSRDPDAVKAVESAARAALDAKKALDAKPLTAAPEQRDAMALLRHVGAMLGSEFRFRWDPVHGRYLLREEPLDNVARSIASQRDAATDTVRRELARFDRAVLDLNPTPHDEVVPSGVRLPPTPAAMLGEALGHIREARELLLRACPGDIVADRADEDMNEAAHRIVGLMREAEAREAASAQPVCTACGHRHGDGVAGWPKACETCNAEGRFCEETR